MAPSGEMLGLVLGYCASIAVWRSLWIGELNCGNYGECVGGCVEFIILFYFIYLVVFMDGSGIEWWFLS